MAKSGLQDLRDAQRDVCKKYCLQEVDPEEMVAVAISTIGAMPIYGTRIALPEGGNISWFFYCGSHSTETDFYKPLHAEHLNEMLPLVQKYLRLPPGANFIIDDKGFEDVWTE